MVINCLLYCSALQLMMLAQMPVSGLCAPFPTKCQRGMMPACSDAQQSASKAGQAEQQQQHMINRFDL